MAGAPVDFGEAFEAERFFIAFYGRADLGRGFLRNLTDGGEGLVGAVRTKEWKRKIGLDNLRPYCYSESRRVYAEKRICLRPSQRGSETRRIGQDAAASTVARCRRSHPFTVRRPHQSRSGQRS